MPRRSSKLTSDQNALVDALVAASRAMVALTAKSLAELDADLTLPQYRALVILASRETMRSTELAQELSVAPSTVTRLGDRLERRGLLRRSERGPDRRTITLTLTDAGRDVIASVMHARRAAIAEVVRTQSLRGTEPAVDVISAFVEALGELPETEWWKALARSQKQTDKSEAETAKSPKRRSKAA